MKTIQSNILNSINLIPLGLVSLSLLSGTILVSSTVSADDTSVVDQINITVPVSCTMSGTGMQSHNANINNGLYDHDIGSTVLHAFCNDNEGFAIYAAGYTGNEVGGANSNKLVGTTASNNATIESGIATTASNPDVSNWAMKLTMTQDSGDTTADNAFTIDSAPNEALPSQAESGATQAPFSQYHVVPNEYVKVAHKNSGTDMTETTGGVKLTTTYAAYISKTQAADTYSGQVIYVLVHPADAAAPTIPKSLDTATTMQEVTYCSEDLPEGQVYTLTDERDGNTYHVARLKDGNCWMLDNLALDPTDPTTASNMNVSNTNATQEAIDNLLNGGSTIAGWSSVAIANVVDDFATSYNSLIRPRINNTSKDTFVTSYGPTSINGRAKVGIYYNFCAASTGTYCYTKDSGVDIPDTIIDAPQDICPANWRMPTGGDGEYYTLSQKYGSNATNTNSLQYNLSVPLSGSYLASSASNQGSYGYWWSSTYYNSNGIYYMSLNSTNVYSNDNINIRGVGMSIRCLMAE